jgi:hypothetical protein
MFYVYMFLDDEDNPYYIGKGCRYRTNHDDKRRKEVPSPKDKSKIVKVKEELTEAAAFALEIELIAKYKRKCDGGILVNKCLGGPGTKGYKHPPGRPSAMKGKKHSAKSKAQMSESAKKRGANTSSTYVLTDKDGNHTVVTNLTAYCREHGLNRKALSNVLCGRAKSSQGYTIQRA